MSPEDKRALRDLRDTIEGSEGKKLLRRTLNHIHALEAKLNTVRTLLRTAMNETKADSGNGDNNVREED